MHILYLKYISGIATFIMLKYYLSGKIFQFHEDFFFYFKHISSSGEDRTVKEECIFVFLSLLPTLLLFCQFLLIPVFLKT